MKNSRPRTPGGRYANGSSDHQGQSWNPGKYTPVRQPKPVKKAPEGTGNPPAKQS